MDFMLTETLLVVPDGVRWLSVDEDGRMYGYGQRPIFDQKDRCWNPRANDTVGCYVATVPPPAEPHIALFQVREQTDGA